MNKEAFAALISKFASKDQITALAKVTTGYTIVNVSIIDFLHTKGVIDKKELVAHIDAELERLDKDGLDEGLLQGAQMYYRSLLSGTPKTPEELRSMFHVVPSSDDDPKG